MIFAAKNARLVKYFVCREYQIGHSLAKLLTEGLVWFPDPISPPALLLWGFPQRDPPLVISSAFKVTSKSLLFGGVYITFMMRHVMKVQELRDNDELGLRGKYLRSPHYGAQLLL